VEIARLQPATDAVFPIHICLVPKHEGTILELYGQYQPRDGVSLNVGGARDPETRGGKEKIWDRLSASRSGIHGSLWSCAHCGFARRGGNCAVDCDAKRAGTGSGQPEAWMSSGAGRAGKTLIPADFHDITVDGQGKQQSPPPMHANLLSSARTRNHFKGLTVRGGQFGSR
jgi:hypothetical protein